MNDMPTIETVLKAPWTRKWLRKALETALQRDPVDAANDAAILSYLLTKRARELPSL